MRCDWINITSTAVRIETGTDRKECVMSGFKTVLLLVYCLYASIICTNTKLNSISSELCGIHDGSVISFLTLTLSVNI